MRCFLKMFLLPAGLSFALYGAAQSSGHASVAPQPTLKEGKAIYERTLQLQINLRNMDENVTRQLPRTRTDSYELLFAPGKSLWQFLPTATSDENTVINSGNGAIQVFKGGSADEVTYTDLEAGKQVSRRELDAKNYLVDEDLKKLAWKLTAESKTILGYVVHKAVAQQYTSRFIMSMENGEMKRQQLPDTVSVVAWYTLSVPVPAGPLFQGQLPGLILELDLNNGRTVYKAVEVTPKVNVANIKEPKGGKRMTAADFTKERDRIMEEMRKSMPAGNRIQISVN